MTMYPPHYEPSPDAGTLYTHKADACEMCRIGRTGHNRRGARTYNQPSPVCGACNLHHWPDTACPAEQVAPGICPRCRKTPRVREHILEAMRPDRTHLSRYCEACWHELGYEWEEPAPGVRLLRKRHSAAEQAEIDRIAQERLEAVFDAPYQTTEGMRTTTSRRTS